MFEQMIYKNVQIYPKCTEIRPFRAIGRHNGASLASLTLHISRRSIISQDRDMFEQMIYKNVQIYPKCAKIRPFLAIWRHFGASRPYWRFIYHIDASYIVVAFEKHYFARSWHVWANDIQKCTNIPKMYRNKAVPSHWTAQWCFLGLIDASYTVVAVVEALFRKIVSCLSKWYTKMYKYTQNVPK
jgi:hypothetical protein